MLWRQGTTYVVMYIKCKVFTHILIGVLSILRIEWSGVNLEYVDDFAAREWKNFSKIVHIFYQAQAWHKQWALMTVSQFRVDAH